MNKSYRNVFNETTGTWVAVQETARAKGKRSTASVVAAGLVAALVGGVALLPDDAHAENTSVGGGTFVGDRWTGIAIGNGSGAGVSSTVAHSDQSIAIGSGAVTTARQSVALGGDAKAEGSSSIAIGGDDIKGINQTTKDSYQTLTGTELSVAYKSTQATKDISMALGMQAEATAAMSTAIGVNAQASANAALALGVAATSSGQSSQRSYCCHRHRQQRHRHCGNSYRREG